MEIPRTPANLRIPLLPEESAKQSIYSEFFSQGYTIQANCSQKDTGLAVIHLKSRGLDVIVHETALDGHGERIPGYNAILVREKQNF